jgi:hypothetical protein
MVDSIEESEAKLAKRRLPGGDLHPNKIREEYEKFLDSIPQRDDIID